VDSVDDEENEDDFVERTSKAKSTWIGPEFSTDIGRRTFKALLPDVNYDYPKPTGLLQRCLHLGLPDRSGLVLDFFAGSGTTAHTVLDLNRQDGGTRKFILVQLPDPTGRKDYPTIAEITKERVRRVIKKFNDEDISKLELDGIHKQDRGFRVFKLTESNFQTWNTNVPQGELAVLEKQLEMHVDHIRDGRRGLICFMNFC